MEQKITNPEQQVGLDANITIDEALEMIYSLNREILILRAKNKQLENEKSVLISQLNN